MLIGRTGLLAGLDSGVPESALCHNFGTPSNKMKYGKLKFNTETGEAEYFGTKTHFRKCSKKYKALKLLMDNRKEAVSYFNLITAISPPLKKQMLGFYFQNPKKWRREKRKLAFLIRDIKKKLGILPEGNPDIIQNKKWRAYRIIVPRKAGSKK